MPSKILFMFDPNEGPNEFLTPVYFDRNVLVKYLYDPRVSVQFASETYGTIYLEDMLLSFGMNAEGAVFAWLGDLIKLPPAEQVHWKTENIPSQNDIKSEFYDAQIGGQFTDPPIALQTINALDNWNAGFARKHGVSLYKPTSFEEHLEQVRRYKRIIIQSEDDFIRFVSELNEIINENVDTDAVRKFLNAKGVTIGAGLKGNKLLEQVYGKVLGDTTNLIEPFFLLYDLRLWADHSMGDDKLKDAATKLGITDLRNFDGILTNLLAKLRDAAQSLSDNYA